MVPYVVRQGDHLPRLAQSMGFDLDTVWNDPSNAKLRELRGDPHILAAGDVVFVPDPAPPTWLPVSMGSGNAFVAKVPTIDLIIDLGTDHANSPYVVNCRGTTTKGTTDGNGTVSLKLPVTATEAMLQLPRFGINMPLKVGHLDPIATTSGLVQRLQHLGYLPRDGSGTPGLVGDKLTQAIAAAVSNFQRDQKLKPSGECDDATASALRDAHGC